MGPYEKNARFGLNCALVRLKHGLAPGEDCPALTAQPAIDWLQLVAYGGMGHSYGSNLGLHRSQQHCSGTSSSIVSMAVTPTAPDGLFICHMRCTRASSAAASFERQRGRLAASTASLRAAARHHVSSVAIIHQRQQQHSTKRYKCCLQQHLHTPNTQCSPRCCSASIPPGHMCTRASYANFLCGAAVPRHAAAVKDRAAGSRLAILMFANNVYQETYSDYKDGSLQHFKPISLKFTREMQLLFHRQQRRKAAATAAGAGCSWLSCRGTALLYLAVLLAVWAGLSLHSRILLGRQPCRCCQNRR